MEHIEKVGNKLYTPDFMQILSKELGQNAEDIIYKKIFGEEENVQVNGKKYTIFPIGNINTRVQGILDGRIPRSRGTDSISGALRILTSKLVPIRINEASVKQIRDSYISHYHDSLGEDWSNDDFDNRLNSLSYVTYKYARDEETNEVFVVGFFGVQIATAAGGKYLTNGELYVLPEFRGRKIATELIHQTLSLAHEDGIDNFDSLTYSVPGSDSLRFWENIGANDSGLYHISGSVSEMLNNTGEDNMAKK